MRNILDFGAVGDGVTVNTKAIQAAIDAGGAVYIPRGVFVTGTLHLKSGGGLYLEEGAVLRAGHDRTDYNAADYCPQNRVFAAEYMVGTHLISAVEQHDVFIGGFGRIDGDSHFWVNEAQRNPLHGFLDHPPMEANRPAQMLFFAECKNVQVQGIELFYAPFWHLFFHGCEDVRVSGLYIKGECQQWVNDGIDIDCCKRVTVSDCIIETGDDAITLRANARQLLHSDGICEDVVISNCVLTSYLDYGIRVGVGDGCIRNCMISNVVIRNSLKGVGIVNRFSEPSLGVSVENMRFQNCSISAHEVIDIRICNQDHFPPCSSPIYTKNITFDQISAYGCRSLVIASYEGAQLSDITFQSMHLHLKQEPLDNDRHICNWRDISHKEAAIYVRDAKRVTFDNVHFLYEGEHNYKSDIVSESGDAVTLRNMY